MRQSETVSNLMAHGVQPLFVTCIIQVVFIHFGDTGLNDLVWNSFQDFIDAKPSRLAIVSVANLHDAIHLSAGIVDGHLLCGKSQSVGIAIVPVVDSLGIFRLPCIIQCVEHFQVEAAYTIRSTPDKCGIISNKRIRVPKIRPDSSKILQHIRKITKIDIAKGIGNVFSGRLTKEIPNDVSTYTEQRHSDQHIDDPTQTAITLLFATTHGGVVAVVVVVSVVGYEFQQQIFDTIQVSRK
mmetsp:Transcript_32771/g.54930  ORF Transcript_32771/g.54930 Transcript_32771/m.54930 type:complete len:239 (+) Transcript_32771:701-1417(+)